MKLLYLVAWCAFLYVSMGCSSSETALPFAQVPEGFCAFVWQDGLSTPRGIYVAENDDVLVVERGKAQVTVIWEENGQRQQTKLAGASGINHGVTVHGDYLYASSDRTVFRWRYQTGQRTDLGTAQVVVTGIPQGGNHRTRTLEFDPEGRLYVSCGSAGNVDPTSIRSRVLRFEMTGTFPKQWSDGFLYADGLRNEIALRFHDSSKKMWGVENGMDNLYRADLGGDIHHDNPSEEVNIFDEPGEFFGYPFCWSEYILSEKYTMLPTGTQWVEPSFSQYDDAWCRNTNNNKPPAFNFPAHTAPMDIIFSESRHGLSFPFFYSEGSFVSFRGSWNRNPPDGYRVEYLEIKDGFPVERYEFLQYEGPGARDPERIKWPHRFVGIGFTKCVYGDCLIAASDASGQIIAVGYDPNQGMGVLSVLNNYRLEIAVVALLGVLVFVIVVVAALIKSRRVAYV